MVTASWLQSCSPLKLVQSDQQYSICRWFSLLCGRAGLGFEWSGPNELSLTVYRVPLAQPPGRCHTLQYKWGRTKYSQSSLVQALSRNSFFMWELFYKLSFYVIVKIYNNCYIHVYGKCKNFIKEFL